MRRAFITGAAGQDGSYLCEFLLGAGYEVHGLVNPHLVSVTETRKRAVGNDRYLKGVRHHQGDLTDASLMRSLIESIDPHEVYNLAAQSHVGQSFERPFTTASVTALGPLNLLEAIYRSGSKARFYQASSSEMFGNVQETPQNELTRFCPRSPYGCAKAFGHFITQNYREAYGLHASNGILFNHESERRGETFVTRKITRAVGRIKHGLQQELVLGSTESKRDWGYAPDYVEAMWLMLQNDKPGDYVIGTGEHHSVQEFVDIAFAHAGLDPQKYVRSDPTFARPIEVNTLRADSTLAHVVLGWKPRVSFDVMVKKMVDHDILLARQETI